MRFFEIPNEDIEKALENNGFVGDYTLASVKCEEIDERAVINIRINKTI